MVWRSLWTGTALTTASDAAVMKLSIFGTDYVGLVSFAVARILQNPGQPNIVPFISELDQWTGLNPNVG
jgi:hypothetical protein